MDADEIVEDLQSKGFLITPEALKLILDSENPRELADHVMRIEGKAMIDVDDLKVREKTKIEAQKEVSVEKTLFRAVARDIEGEVNVVSSGIQESTGDMGDFVEHFRSRFEKISEILRRRGGGLTSISNAKKKQHEKVRIIGMVSEKKNTKNGHVYLKLEDTVSNIDALVPAGNAKALAVAQQLLSDETIAVDGRMSKSLFIVDEIMQPDVEIGEVKRCKDDIIIAMTSDMHVGSKLFMKDNFEYFIRWLKGQVGTEKEREIASRIKYLTLAGDLCDGIGIFPGQEDELEITDIFEQYELLTQYLEQIPEYIEVIVMPGNHDAVRNADPQPQLPKELVPRLYGMKNMTMISSPGMVELHGFKTLMYHGSCFADLVSNIPRASFDSPDILMEEMLKRRHLHPFYGGKPIVPQRDDSMVISTTPDIFHTGEAHHNAYNIYRGVVCVSSGTWQALSEYQIKQGHKATPAILPVFEGRTGRIKAVHFDKALSIEVVK